ncbi:uncharacterized protein LOC135925075 [Gordionus sp. m RMFG-2023]|uniref:uncharacterized protein LOC135925075 n=1 Tax=Gordionus sp. m RMFG-2023 TaxID=3053472 RepID=UPI0031FE334C
MGHQGYTKTKLLAQENVWWPNINEDIELHGKNCELCQTNNPGNKTIIGKWPSTNKPWGRIHLDFAGPINGDIYLVIIDSFSKWSEIQKMTTNNFTEVRKLLLRHFAIFDYPNTIVTDNGPPFQNFLFNYRNTPQITTKQSPSSIILKFQPIGPLQLIKPNYPHPYIPQLPENWIPGIIVKRTGPMAFLVETKLGVWRRHINQLKHRFDNTDLKNREEGREEETMQTTPQMNENYHIQNSIAKDIEPTQNSMTKDIDPIHELVTKDIDPIQDSINKDTIINDKMKIDNNEQTVVENEITSSPSKRIRKQFIPFQIESPKRRE